MASNLGLELLVGRFLFNQYLNFITTTSVGKNSFKILSALQ